MEEEEAEEEEVAGLLRFMSRDTAGRAQTHVGATA